MLVYFKMSFKYVFILLILYQLYLNLIYQEKSKFENSSNSKINFITNFPEIKPEKCLKTGPFVGGILLINMEFFNTL